MTEMDALPLPAVENNVPSPLDERSELAQEFISRKPDFIERWALVMFLGILLLLLAASWFIKYPDIIEVQAVLTARDAPKEIIPRQDGRLVRLLVHNNEQVNKYQVIGWLESTASHTDVIALSSQIDSSILLLNQGRVSEITGMINRNYSNLGEIQPGYQQFITAWQQFNDYMINGFYARKKATLEHDILTLKATRQTIDSQRSLAAADIKLAKESYDMNKSLYDEKVLNKEDLRIQASRYVNKQLALPQLDAAFLSNEMQEQIKLREIDQLDHDFAQQRMVFSQTLQSLKSEINAWLLKYVLQSPVTGNIYFTIPLQENQYIKAGTLLGYVSPKESHFYAQANLSQYNFGKVSAGLPVQLRFDAYPYQEMGFVEGTLDYISNVPSDSGFFSTVKLEKGLVTNNGKQIPYKNGLKAQGIIITNNMRLAERFYYNVVKSTSIGHH